MSLLSKNSWGYLMGNKTFTILFAIVVILTGIAHIYLFMLQRENTKRLIDLMNKNRVYDYEWSSSTQSKGYEWSSDTSSSQFIIPARSRINLGTMKITPLTESED